jgi:RNA polymerase sigma factor (sigma-70 family)
MAQGDPALDGLLVVRSQRGDAAAFRRLVERWQGRLASSARRLTGDEHAALDAVQETWTTVIRRLRGLHDPQAFATWAYRILRNKCIDLHRRNARRAEVHEAAAREARPPADPADALSLEDALARLPEQQRATVVLYYWDGFSVPEIAEIEGVPAGTVKSRLYGAREVLRRILKEEDDEQTRR